MDIHSYLTKRRALVNRALERYLPPAHRVPGEIHRAMRYSVLGEGKRIRPILALASCEAVGGRPAAALPASCALELIHAYSLVHDDLPAMDDDDFRRGRPSCHKKFGEAIGILAGDALLTFAFELLARSSGAPSVALRVVREVAAAIGTRGMIGGQVADVRFNHNGHTPAKLIEAINVRKTGALIACSVRVGGLLGGGSGSADRALGRYGERIGLVFQLVDDLLDRDGAVREMGAEAVRRRAERLTEEAEHAVAPLGRRARPLRDLARFILTRGS